MNKVCLIGRTTKDIELKSTKKGTPVVQFSLAVNRDHKNANGEYETDFINCIAYKVSAEILGKYVKKGDLISIEGTIQTGSYDTPEGKRYTTDVLVEKLGFLSTKKKETSIQENKEVKKDPYEEMGDEVELTEEDLPFDFNE